MTPESQENGHPRMYAADIFPWGWVAVLSSTTDAFPFVGKYKTRTGRLVFRLAVLALGATSLVEHLFLDSTNHSTCQVALGTIRCFRWASYFNHLPVTVLPGIFACTGITTQRSYLNNKKNVVTLWVNHFNVNTCNLVKCLAWNWRALERSGFYLSCYKGDRVIDWQVAWCHVKENTFHSQVKTETPKLYIFFLNWRNLNWLELSKATKMAKNLGLPKLKLALQAFPFMILQVASSKTNWKHAVWVFNVKQNCCPFLRGLSRRQPEKTVDVSRCHKGLYDPTTRWRGKRRLKSEFTFF